VIILDTDHIVTLKHENDPHWNTLTTNLVSSADQDFATTAITVEEQNRGWLALINRYTDVTQAATLLSANLRDFEQVPGLCVENWLE
jgi:predicted nucleic acid-binding protein